ncbi:hypothetical protein ACXYMU_03400 [Pontibacter sp. CAU 1760]
MKKIFCSLFAVSALLFTASCSEDRGTTTEVVDSNEDENVNPNHIRGYGDAEPGGVAPADPEAGQMYGFSTEELSTAITTDLGVDADVATKMVQVYYDRDRQLSEMEAAVREQADNPDRKRIDTDADSRIKGMLTPEQYKSYEQNRSKYHEMTRNRTAVGTEN